MCHRPGDRVFAKIKGYSNWPARINPLPPDVHIPKGRLPVFFYGTYEVSFVPIKNIVPYEKFKNKWGKAKSNPQFMTAMKEIESDPWMFMLGEDPRAEAFLLQFYNFKPSDSVPSTGFIQLSGHPKPTVSPTPDSPRSLSSLRSGEIASETSSEVSSVLSKQDSAEANVASDEEEEGNNTMTKRSSVDASTQGDVLSDEECGADNSLSRLSPIPASDLDSDGYEARRLARKLQKKAEKKALKKAAKREAKRLAKEAERAEKRARREAKRELKRLHRLKKQRMLMEQSDVPPGNGSEAVSNDVQSLALESWTENQIDFSDTHTFSPTAQLPYDELIAAELEDDYLSPVVDRPTSPLKLDDYAEPTVVDSDTREIVSPDSSHSESRSVIEAVPPSNRPQAGFKRSLTHSSVPTASVSDHPLSVGTKVEEALPHKRTKLETPSQSLEDSNGFTKSQGPSVKPEKEVRRSVSPGILKGKTAGVKSLSSSKGPKSVSARRRRLIDSSSSEEDSHQGSSTRPADSGSREPSPTPMASKKLVQGAVPLKSSGTNGETMGPGSSSNAHSKKQRRPDDNPTRRQSKPTESDVPTNEKMHPVSSASRTPDTAQSQSTSSPPTDVVAQLCHLCRELKTSLVRGHENFSLAVQILSQLATMHVRLPQLAQARDLMDSIKKANVERRSPLSVISWFVAQTQALITAHQTRPTIIKTESNSQISKRALDRPLPGQIDLTRSATVDPQSTTSVISGPSASDLPPKSTTVETESLTADLAAKVDDMLSLIRATDERMAAAATSHPKASGKSILTSVQESLSSTISTEIGFDNGRNIRASAVAAAAAHMHDEEDEESVMSRVEQVAAFEAASKLSSNYMHPAGIPPPPPPPPPVHAGSFHIPPTSPPPSHPLSPSAVDLDLDSRIEMLITGPKTSDIRSKSNKTSPVCHTDSKLPDPNIQSPPKAANQLVRTSDNGPVTLAPTLLARRHAIAEKIAIVTGRVSNLTPVKSNASKSSGSQSERTSIPLTSTSQSTSKDDELYDLLGV
ncbi:hypothetical protein EG68_02781 [Paragonimus skrjabini miyazakii]|uniref:PWWP domain-containing protein n=1 Tax=Paragonimus skrjabini miyazakii TaxID=59628 RepID=A0A8S9YX89_9TREM|nr:hypothetical protein EG68_02781 [Paragonimus skrjabini miyazakii]